MASAEQRMFVLSFDAEKFSRQGKSGDLTAAVAEKLEGSNRAVDHFVEILDWLPFAENFDIFGNTLSARLQAVRPNRVEAVALPTRRAFLQYLLRDLVSGACSNLTTHTGHPNVRVYQSRP